MIELRMIWYQDGVITWGLREAVAIVVLLTAMAIILHWTGKRGWW